MEELSIGAAFAASGVELNLATDNLALLRALVSTAVGLRGSFVPSVSISGCERNKPMLRMLTADLPRGDSPVPSSGWDRSPTKLRRLGTAFPTIMRRGDDFSSANAGGARMSLGMASREQLEVSARAALSWSVKRPMCSVWCTGVSCPSLGSANTGPRESLLLVVDMKPELRFRPRGLPGIPMLSSLPRIPRLKPVGRPKVRPDGEEGGCSDTFC